MNIPRGTTLTSSILHECGEYLEFTIHVQGEQATATLKEGRFTFTSYFAKNTIHYRGHGTRSAKCTACKKPLPRTIEQWNDADFRQKSSEVKA